MEGTIFTAALDRVQHVKSEEGEILTMPFLDLCKTILPVLVQYVCQEHGNDTALGLVYMMLDNFGTAMAPVKSDIGGNISRLETKYSSNPSKFNLLYSIIRPEIEAKTAKASSSCTNALLWLTRAMDFLVELFHNLLLHPDWSMSQVCSDSYSKTLKKWHGWLASSSFTVALKLAPDRKKFMDIIGGKCDPYSDMEKFCAKFPPFLEENHKFLASVGMDTTKA